MDVWTFGPNQYNPCPLSTPSELDAQYTNLLVGAYSKHRHQGNLTATNLLEKPLKGFIVNPTDVPREGVKRLATSGERVNHGSWVKMYNLCRVLKTVIIAVLMDTSGLDSLWNNNK